MKNIFYREHLSICASERPEMIKQIRSAFRLAVPIVLVGLCVWLLVGCYPFPSLAKNPQDIRDRFGNANSHRDFQVGLTQRDQIVAAIGRPDAQSNDKKRMLYRGNHEVYVWVFPLCFTSEAVCENYGVELYFKDDGTLKNFYLLNEVQTHALLEHLEAAPSTNKD